MLPPSLGYRQYGWQPLEAAHAERIAVSGLISMNAKTRIAFGRCGDWENLVATTLDPQRYSFRCVDFTTFDLSLADAAVPLTLDEAATLRRRFGNHHPKFILPEPDVAALCADKRHFNEAMLAREFRAMIPPLYGAAERRWPYLLKRRDALSGNEIFVLRNAEDEARHAEKLRDDAYFCQKYVPGRVEYATHMLLTEGELRYHSTNLYEMAEEYSVKGSGLAPLRERIGAAVAPTILDALTALLRAIGFNGTCCVDYKLEDGEIRLLEVNPRCGFSLFRDINAYLEAYLAVLAEAAQAACGQAEAAR